MMSKKKLPVIFKLLFAVVLIALISYIFLLPSKKGIEEVSEESILNGLDSTDNIFKYKNILFSLPSPFQISMLLQKTGIQYNKSILNSTRNASFYVSNFSKAINFGLYGSDLGYINIYEQTQDAASYFAVLKILSQEIGLYNALDKPTIERIETNIENRDSMMVIIANTYRKIDHYLKQNNRGNTGTLIIAGGWIESVYILTQQIIDSEDPQLYQRIAEQKRPLENLIKLLVPYSNKSQDNYFLVDRLIDLAYAFDEIEDSYEYIMPKTTSEDKLTVINSNSRLVIEKEDIDTISKKIAIIRTHVTK